VPTSAPATRRLLEREARAAGRQVEITTFINEPAFAAPLADNGCNQRAPIEMMHNPAAAIRPSGSEGMPPAFPATRQRYILVALLFLHTFNTYLDRVCISAAATDIKRDLAISDQMMGHIFAMFAIGYALFQIPAGWVADKFGPRSALAWIVGVWSVFTCLSGAAFNAASLLIIRFLFGIGEAGAFPGATRALYAWVSARERGIAQGIFHSGARVGAALSLLFLPSLILQIGWRWTFVFAGSTGFVWAAVWYFWFRDNPADHPKVNAAELALIRSDEPAEMHVTAGAPPLWTILTSSNLLLAMFQYAASNVTFFISFTWLLPYLQSRWGPETAKLAPVPLLFGMCAQWVAGSLVTALHQRGWIVGSRRIPAITGFVISAIGLVLCTLAAPDSPWAFVLCFGVAVFGAEMTISPSWAFCMDIGGAHSGTVSGAMNMVGNLGSAASAILFPWFVAHVTMPVVAEAPGTANAFFIFAAVLNLLAAGVWLGMNPRRAIAADSPARARLRVAIFVLLILAVVGLVVLPKFFFK
jgi:ACS family glucarate transporter-like MFS transporter